MIPEFFYIAIVSISSMLLTAMRGREPYTITRSYIITRSWQAEDLHPRLYYDKKSIDNQDSHIKIITDSIITIDPFL